MKFELVGTVEVSSAMYATGNLIYSRRIGSGWQLKVVDDEGHRHGTFSGGTLDEAIAALVYEIPAIAPAKIRALLADTDSNCL